MKITATALDGVLILEPPRFGDDRGWLSVVYAQPLIDAAGIDFITVQDNISLSRAAFTVRGLHFQRPPVAQPKLVQVLAGRIIDVVLDLRRGSASFGRHLAVELSAATGRQILIPAGFAHGFCTLEPDTLIHYKCAAPYAPDHEGGVLWHDPALGIDWPVAPDHAVVSDRDRALPPLGRLDLPDW